MTATCTRRVIKREGRRRTNERGGGETKSEGYGRKEKRKVTLPLLLLQEETEGKEFPKKENTPCNFVLLTNGSL